MSIRDQQTREGRQIPIGTIALATIVIIAVAAAAFFTLQGRARTERPLMTGGGASIPTAVASPAVAPEAAAIETSRVENAEGAILARLTKDYGVSCFSGSDATVARPKDLPERLDAHIQAAGISEGWLPSDEKDWWFSAAETLWVGSVDSYAREFGADTIYTDEHATWLFAPDEKLPRAIEVMSFESAKGTEVWTAVGGLAPGQICEASEE